MTDSLHRIVHERIADMIWRQWRTLGVPARAEVVRETIIDPESLIVITALVTTTTDSRIRVGALEWCVRNHHLVSSGRLARMASMMSPKVAEAVSEFVAAVNTLVPSARWKQIGESRSSGVFKLPGKEPAPINSGSASLLKLRVRTIAGATVRSEALSVLVAYPGSHVTSAVVARHSLFVQRHVKDALDDLAIGGWAERWKDGREYLYRVTEQSIAAFEPLPIWVGWIDRMRALLALESAALLMNPWSLDNIGKLMIEIKIAEDAFRAELISIPTWEAMDSKQGHDRLSKWIDETSLMLVSVV